MSYLETLLSLAILFQTIKHEGYDFFPFFPPKTGHMDQWNERTYWVFDTKGNSFYLFLILF